MKLPKTVQLSFAFIDGSAAPGAQQCYSGDFQSLADGTIEGDGVEEPAVEA